MRVFFIYPTMAHLANDGDSLTEDLSLFLSIARRLSPAVLRIKLIRHVDAVRHVIHKGVTASLLENGGSKGRGEDEHAMMEGCLVLITRRDGNPIGNGSIRGDK